MTGHHQGKRENSRAARAREDAILALVVEAIKAGKPLLQVFCHLRDVDPDILREIGKHAPCLLPTRPVEADLVVEPA